MMTTSVPPPCPCPCKEQDPIIQRQGRQEKRTERSGEEAALSPAQQRLWFLHQLQPEVPVSTVAVEVRISGELDAAALRGALGEVVRRHDALRTVFTPAGGGPVRTVLPRLDVPLAEAGPREVVQDELGDVGASATTGTHRSPRCCPRSSCS